MILSENNICFFVTEQLDCDFITEDILKQFVISAIEEGKTNFIIYFSGQADIWLANMILDLREKNKEIKLNCIVGNEEKFDFIQKIVIYNIITEADKVCYI